MVVMGVFVELLRSMWGWRTGYLRWRGLGETIAPPPLEQARGGRFWRLE